MNYGISTPILEEALLNMQIKGFLEETATVEDLISFTRSAVEDIPFMVVAKINQWAQGV